MDDDLREQVLISKVGLSKEQAENLTPTKLKELKPVLPEDAPRKCYLCWMISTSTFRGYYPKPFEESAGAKPKKRARKKLTQPEKDTETHVSRSRKHGKVHKSMRTKFQALWQVVSFLWQEHADRGFDARILLTLFRFQGELQYWRSQVTL